MMEMMTIWASLIHSTNIEYLVCSRSGDRLGSFCELFLFQYWAFNQCGWDSDMGITLPPRVAEQPKRTDRF